MKALTVAVFAALCAAPLAAQEAPAPPAPAFPLSQALEMARERNPQIKASRAQWEAAQARVLPAKTWGPPQVGVEYWGFSGASVGGAPEKWYDLDQDIPFPGKLRLRGEAAAHEARREEEVYKGVQLDVLTRVKDAYYRYLYTAKAKQILEENVDIMRRFSKTAESKYSTGKASQSDVLRAEVELTKTLAALLTLEQQRDSAQAELNGLLDRAPDEALGAPQDPSLDPLHWSYPELESAALSQRPEVREAGHHVDHTKAALAAQRSEYLPDFAVQYSRRDREGLPSDSIGMLKISLPFLYFWRTRAQVREASDELAQAQDMLRSAQDMARSDLKDRWTKVQTVGRLVELYRTSILPQASQSLKVTEAAYQTDRVDFLNLLDSERALLEFRLDYDQYVSRYGQDVAALERVLGVSLDALKAPAAEEHQHDH